MLVPVPSVEGAEPYHTTSVSCMAFSDCVSISSPFPSELGLPPLLSLPSS